MYIFLAAVSGAVGFTVGGLIGGLISGPPFNSWIGVIGTVLGVICGAGVTYLRDWHKENKNLQGHLESVILEMQMVHSLANGYLKAQVKSPLYRFPTTAFENSLPALLTKGVFNSREASALQHFLVDLQAINRSLDYAHSFLTLYEKNDAAEKPLFDREINRAARKIKRYAAQPLGTAELYAPAFDILSKRLPRETIQRISFNLDSEP